MIGLFGGWIYMKVFFTLCIFAIQLSKRHFLSCYISEMIFLSPLSQLQAPEKLMEYLITLGSNSMSKSFLIRHILSEISTLADQLWQAFQVNTPTASPHVLLHSHQPILHLPQMLSFSWLGDNIDPSLLVSACKTSWLYSTCFLVCDRVSNTGWRFYF